MTIIATYTVSDGFGDKVAELLKGYVPKVLTEPGCIAFDVYRSNDNPNRFVLVEQYTGQAAVEAHMSADHFDEVAVKQIRPLLADRSVEFLTKQ